MPRPDWPTAAPFIPAELTLPALVEAARGCRGCPLWEPATQVVFGAGPADARLVLVGEQPGDQARDAPVVPARPDDLGR
ncbi:MAG: hypothetical protein KY439_12450 [Actinobacteria bacterium]|nr:hypothetical protein [Actinomycetota bacterium]